MHDIKSFFKSIDFLDDNNIFNETENQQGINITKYINKEGLKGKYSIYIEIDGILYNTKKYVVF